MHTKILIVTNDNVLFLLLKTFIESLDSELECVRITDHQQLKEYTDIKLIIVDGKMINISPIELIYLMRYEYMILSNIWFITEIRSEGYLKKALEVGANRIIEKPFNTLEFSDEVIKYIQKVRNYLNKTE